MISGEVEVWRGRGASVAHGEPFECTHRADSTLSGNYLGNDEAFAKEHLKRWVIGYRGDFSPDEVTELTEHREDRLGHPSPWFGAWPK